MSRTRIAAATGRAGGTGVRLGALIEAAMGQAAVAMNERGIVDDTPPQRVAELLGPEYTGKCGADVIREAKIAARLATKRAAEKAEAERIAAEVAAAEAAATADK